MKSITLQMLSPPTVLSIITNVLTAKSQNLNIFVPPCYIHRPLKSHVRHVYMHSCSQGTCPQLTCLEHVLHVHLSARPRNTQTQGDCLAGQETLTNTCTTYLSSSPVTCLIVTCHVMAVYHTNKILVTVIAPLSRLTMVTCFVAGPDRGNSGRFVVIAPLCP